MSPMKRLDRGRDAYSRKDFDASQAARAREVASAAMKELEGSGHQYTGAWSTAVSTAL